MSRPMGLQLVIPAVALLSIPHVAFGDSNSIMERASPLFGQPLNADHGVFRFSGSWLILMCRFPIDLFPDIWLAPIPSTLTKCR